MRRLPLALTLSLLGLLLFAQQGAMLHELSHLHYSGRSVAAQLHESALAQDAGRCLTCQAFAQVTHPAPTSPSVPTDHPNGALPAPAPLYSVVDAAAPTPHSRGPPHA